MVSVTQNQTGWDAWSPELAEAARTRYKARDLRLDREQRDNDERLAQKAAAKLVVVNAEDLDSEAGKKEQERKRAIIAAAIARAQNKKL
jgi:electron transport complex protein RnfB